MSLAEPLQRFAEWWREQQQQLPGDLSSAMVLSSVDARGHPSSRVVLLRGFDARGFVFYTNLESRKARELLAHPFAALNFHWQPRQVRVEGRIERVDDAEADAYFCGRPRDSQIGAWASDQSRPMRDRQQLVDRVEELRRRFDGQPVPRPPHWSGLRVVPDMIEFWLEGEFRLHTRERYDLVGGEWQRTLLFP